MLPRWLLAVMVPQCPSPAAMLLTAAADNLLSYRGGHMPQMEVAESTGRRPPRSIAEKSTRLGATKQVNTP